MKNEHQGLLGWIIAFKAFKAVALTAIGIALITTRHSDLLDLLVRLAMAVHLPLSSHLLDWLLTVASTLTITKRTALGITAFGYAVLMASEGVALHLRRPWAFWFTIIATCTLIPVEVYEIVRKPDALRILVLVVNVGIVAYLWQQGDLAAARKHK